MVGVTASVGSLLDRLGLDGERRDRVAVFFAQNDRRELPEPLVAIIVQCVIGIEEGHIQACALWQLLVHRLGLPKTDELLQIAIDLRSGYPSEDEPA